MEGSRWSRGVYGSSASVWMQNPPYRGSSSDSRPLEYSANLKTARKHAGKIGSD